MFKATFLAVIATSIGTAPSLVQAAPAAPAAHAGHAMTTTAPTVADGQGIVRAIDSANGLVTIEHAPIPSLKWPAMTMKMKANPTSVLRGLSVGQSIKFRLKQTGNDTEVTSIQPN